MPTAYTINTTTVYLLSTPHCIIFASFFISIILNMYSFSPQLVHRAVVECASLQSINLVHLEVPTNSQKF